MAFLVVRPAQCQWKVEVALASFVLFATQPVVGVTMVSLLRSPVAVAVEQSRSSETALGPLRVSHA